MNDEEAAEELDFEIKRLRLEPGDVIIIRTTMTLSREIADRFTAYMQGVVGKGYPVVILADGMKLEVLNAPPGAVRQH